MNLDLNNEIDKRFATLFSNDVIESVNPDNLDFLGMNVSFDDESDISLKVYYVHDYSAACYNNEEDNEPFIKFIKSKDMLNFFSVVRDSAHNNKEIYEVKLSARDNSNMLELFSFLENYISFFGKYKDEIVKLSTMQNRVYDGYDYASFYFFSVVKRNEEVTAFKCYWDNNYKIQNDDYFFKFLEESGVEGFQRLLPVAKTIIQNCGGHLCFEGINYNKDYSEKHKIYMTDQDNLYDGLYKTFPENTALHKKLHLIEEWQKVHPEFYCDIFAIGQDDKGNLILNIYFKFIQDDAEEI